MQKTLIVARVFLVGEKTAIIPPQLNWERQPLAMTLVSHIQKGRKTFSSIPKCFLLKRKTLGLAYSRILCLLLLFVVGSTAFFFLVGSWRWLDKTS